MYKTILVSLMLVLLGALRADARPRSVQLSYGGACGFWRTAFCARYDAANCREVSLAIWLEEDFPKDSVMWSRVSLRYHHLAFTPQQLDTLSKMLQRDGLPMDRDMPIERYLRRHWFRTTDDGVMHCVPVIIRSEDQRRFERTAPRR